MIKNKFLLKGLIIISSLFILNNAKAQSIQQLKIKELSYLTGKWLGQSRSFENEQLVKSIPAYEEISFRLDSSIITIDLKSESLQLHTVITYSENDSCYYYHPFYKTGNAKYPASLENGQFIVRPSDSKRFIFRLNAEGKFIEYGEVKVNGQWQKYFEDTFERM